MDKRARFEFFGSLNFFLREESCGQGMVDYVFSGMPSVKDSIEALGVPHTEVAYIADRGRAIDFTFRLAGQESIEVYPYDHIHISAAIPLSPLVPEGNPSFIADVHLGRLARYLRVAGFDTIYEKKDLGDEAIAHIAAKEERIVLTRDVGLLKRSIIHYGYVPRSSNSRQQFREVVNRYSLKKLFNAFSRCVHCNGFIDNVEKKEIEDSLPEGIKRDFDNFFMCLQCRHVYWKGSHYKRISHMFEQV